MTDVQRIVSALADCLHDNQISEDECLGVLKALRGIPPEKHMDALKAFLSVEEPELEEQPEDYLAVKTYTSSEFHVGDEVKSIYSGERAIILKNSEGGNNSRFYVVFPDGSAESGWNKDKWHRTGRNFPAVQAILDELKKA